MHRNNARSHVASYVRNFLEKCEILTVAHPRYSPDLTSCDFWLFPSIKKALWGHQFSSNQEMVTASQTFFNSLSHAAFEKTIMTKWRERMNTYIKSHDQYFEKGPVTSNDSESD